METKTLQPAGLFANSMGFLFHFFGILLVLYVMEWVLGEWGINITVTQAGITLGLTVAIVECFFSKLPFMGMGVSVCISLGQTMALSVFYWPLPPQEMLFIWFTLSLVSYNFGLARIARLKKQGYTEKQNDEPAQG